MESLLLRHLLQAMQTRREGKSQLQQQQRLRRLQQLPVTRQLQWKQKTLQLQQQLLLQLLALLQWRL
jgi:hypothetical protein